MVNSVIAEWPAIPTIEEEDAKRPCRERENLVGERTRIINRLKADLTRLGIRGFKPQLRKASQLLPSLRTPEDSPIPSNTLDEMQRDLARLALIREQIKAIEQARQARLEKAPQSGPDAMIRMLASIRYDVDISAVPEADKDRLVKQCTANAAPCVATVTGVETETGVKAASVKFFN